MAPIKFIAVPVGTSTGPEWRGVIARYGEAGYKIYYCASVLSELAAKADRGGLLVYPSGEPKTALELCAELGVEALWAAETLFPALERLGEGSWTEAGAWQCSSPMISRTLEWREGEAQKLLPALIPKSNGKLMFSQPLSDTEYRRWRKKCQLPSGVTMVKPCPRLNKQDKTCLVLAGKCPVCPLVSGCSPVVANGHKRTNNVEDADITGSDDVRLSDNIIEVKDKRTAAGKNGQAQAAAFSLPQPKTLPPDGVMAAIDRLPQAVRPECLAVVSDRLYLPTEVLISNIQLLASRLASAKAKGIDNSGGWLITALDDDHAASKRLVDAEAEEARRVAAENRRLKEEQKDRERLIELQRQVQILDILGKMTPEDRAKIEAEAVLECKEYGGTIPELVQSCVINKVAQKYSIPS